MRAEKSKLYFPEQRKQVVGNLLVLCALRETGDSIAMEKCSFADAWHEEARHGQHSATDDGL